MNYLLYLVYGSEGYTQEALYSLISYYRLHEENENTVLIYTDNAALLKKYVPPGVIYISLTPLQMQEWQGAIKYNHRLKIKVLQDALSRFTGNFLFADTDTVFTKNISVLFDKIRCGEILFHKSEGRLLDNKGGIARKMRKFLKRQNSFFVESRNEYIKMDATLMVWNSGNIGINNSFAQNLIEVENLVDSLYSSYKFTTMEQIGFSYIVQEFTTPIPTDDYVYHYWYFKEFKVVLAQFFSHNKDKSLKELVSEIEKIDPEYLSSEKWAYKQMSFWRKQYTKITKGRKWKILDYKL
jgi:hypothetical protein